MTPAGMLDGLRVLDLSRIIARPAPLLGQHTREVLEELGLPRGEIDRLAAARAVQLGPAG